MLVNFAAEKHCIITQILKIVLTPKVLPGLMFQSFHLPLTPAARENSHMCSRFYLR